MMLYLVRHAEPNPVEVDPERSLSARGRSDIKRVASFCAVHSGIAVERILHSGKTRALQTAQILAEHLKPATGIDRADGLAPLDDPSPWAEELGTADRDMMLVGHNPFMERLAGLLLSGKEDDGSLKFGPATIACIERDSGEQWKIVWIVNPEMV
jgi:phosphohistidine phosphatase